VVVITLVLVEYVWPPEEAQKKEIVAVVGVLVTTAVVVVPVSVGSSESVMFQPELPMPPKEVLVEVTKEETVLVLVMWIVDVRSGLMKLVDVEVSAAGVIVVVCVRVVCMVVEEVSVGLDCSMGVTITVVVAVVRDAPLEGETPLSQSVDPETTEKTKGRVLEADTGAPDDMAEMTVSVFVLKSIEVLVDVWMTREVELESIVAGATSAEAGVHAVGDTKIDSV
jgi:hypothetical protein